MLELLRVEINRAEWDITENKEKFIKHPDDIKKVLGEGRLINKDTGLKCCLGFLGLVCGIEPKKLLDIGDPRDVICSRWPKELLSIENRLMCLNDSEDLTALEKEKLIYKEGLKANIEFIFTGKYLK